MVLQYIIDNLEAVDEAVRQFYQPQGDKFVLQITGIKSPSEFDAVQTALNKERDDHKATKVKLQDYDKLRSLRLNPSEILEKMDRFDELEAAAADKIDDEKINQMVETRIKTKLAPIQRENDELKTQVQEKDSLISDFQEKDRTRTIHDAVRKAATEAKVVDTALDDILMIAERVFDVTEDNVVVTKENVGATPNVEAAVWFSDMQNSRPHWWPASQGGGAGGSNGKGGSTVSNPWSKDNWHMTKQTEIYKADPKKAEQLATAAGTTIGGPRPK